MKKKTLTLISSCAAIAVCSSLIVGSTYALFTSEDKVNIAVTAGKVAVKAEIGELTTYSMGIKQSGGNWENGGEAFVDDNGEVILERIVPGDSVEIPVSVTNSSTVDILYNMQVVLSEEDKLAEGLEVSVSVDGKAYKNIVSYTSAWQEYNANSGATVTISLPYTAGNEYMLDENGDALSTSIKLSVGAVQANGAEAGTGKDVRYRGLTYVESADELKAALAAGKNVGLTCDLLNVDAQFVLNDGASLDLNGHTISKTASKNGSDHLFTVNVGANSVIKNGSIIDDHSGAETKPWGYVINNHGELTLEDMNMESSNNTSSMICNYSNQDSIAKLTIKSGNYVGHDMIVLKCDRWSETYIEGGRIETNNGTAILCYAKLVIEDGEFVSAFDSGVSGNEIALAVSSGSYMGSVYKSDVTINGGTFDGSLLVLNGYGFTGTEPGNTNVTINGGTFGAIGTEYEYKGKVYKLAEKDSLVINENIKYANFVASQAKFEEAIASLKDGDVIELAVSTYTVSKNNWLKITANEVTIKGSGADTVIDCGNSNVSGQAGMLVSGDNVIISDLTVKCATQAAIKVTKIGEESNVKKVTIKNVTVESAKSNGIDIHGVEGATIDNVTVAVSGKCGFAVSRATDVVFTNCTVNVTEGGWMYDIGCMYKAGAAGYETPSSITIGAGNNFQKGLIYSNRPKDAEKGADKVYFDESEWTLNETEDGQWQLLQK